MEGADFIKSSSGTASSCQKVGAIMRTSRGFLQHLCSRMCCAYRGFAQHNIDHAEPSWLLAAPEEQQPTAGDNKSACEKCHACQRCISKFLNTSTHLEDASWPRNPYNTVICGVFAYSGLRAPQAGLPPPPSTQRVGAEPLAKLKPVRAGAVWLDSISCAALADQNQTVTCCLPGT